ncbi:MAG: DUF971 domain-containing protein [Alkalimonas sp.]|nr:DUF971 domain-containing protein [Alkalimonas sp.]
MSSRPQLTKLHYRKRSKQLELHFADGSTASLSAEFLRVHSPSAEVRGHGKPVLVQGKAQVGIHQLEPSGHYGVCIHFDDGHRSGIYHFDYLHQLASQQHALWQQYQQRLEEAQAKKQQVPIRFVDADAPK